MLTTLGLLVLSCGIDSSREERVLELLRNLEREEGSWRYHGASFVPWSKREEQLVPRYILLCGTLSEEADDDRFRDLAVDVLRIYGLRPERDVAWSDEHGSARLDAYDADRRIGFELRARRDGDPLSAPNEDVGEFLDDVDIERLRATGSRLYVADDVYSDDEDGFTAALAFLAGLVRFLNEHTDGEDVNLGGLLFECEATWSWWIPPVRGVRAAPHETYPATKVLTVERAATVTIPCGGLTDFGPPGRYQLPGFEASHPRCCAPPRVARRRSWPPSSR